MEIKVYISQPYAENGYKGYRNIMDRLNQMVDIDKAHILSLNFTRSLVAKSPFDDLATEISEIAKADFVIFGENWKLDRRCLVEDEIVTRYGIPHCEVDDLETFFSDYICKAFKFDTKNSDI